MRILVIDEKIAREGMLDFLDFLERNREVRGDFNLIITHGVRASDILGVTYPLQKASTIKLHNQLDSIVQNWGGDPDVQLNDVIKAWISPGRDPVMAAVSIKGDPKKGLSTNNMKKVRPDAIVVADSLGVFKKNRLKGFLTLEDTRNYLFTQNKISHTALSVPCGKNKFIAIRIFNSKTKTNAKMVKGVPVINMKINSEAYLDGMQCPDDINQIKTYLKYEQLTEKKIKKMITATIQKAQKKYQADIFGFGEVLYRHNNQDFKKVENKWDDYFKNAIVNIDVNVVIRRTGNRTRSLISSIK